MEKILNLPTITINLKSMLCYNQTLNENFDLLNGLYSLSDIEDYMKLLKHMKL